MWVNRTATHYAYPAVHGDTGWEMFASRSRSDSNEDDDKRVPLTPDDKMPWLHADAPIFNGIPPPLPDDNDEAWEPLQEDHQLRLDNLETTIRSLQDEIGRCND